MNQGGGWEKGER